MSQSVLFERLGLTPEQVFTELTRRGESAEWIKDRRDTIGVPNDKPVQLEEFADLLNNKKDFPYRSGVMATLLCIEYLLRKQVATTGGPA